MQFFVENPECPYSEDKLEDFTEDEISNSLLLKEWISRCSDKDNPVVKELQNNFSDTLPSCTVECHLAENKNISRVIGDKDELGNIHGEAEVFFDNGDYLWADFNHGVREGSASLVLKSGEHYLGHYRNGRLSGLVEETIEYGDKPNVHREVYYKVGLKDNQIN